MKLPLVAAAAALVSSCALTKPDTVCHQGAYQLADGRTLVIGRSAKDTLRYRLIDGTTGRLFPQKDGAFAAGAGWLKAPPPVTTTVRGGCGSDTLSFEQEGRAQQAQRVPLDVRETSFRSGGLVLRGRLVTPKGNEPLPLAVYVHGSEATSAVDAQLDQFMSPANGVAAFVYDKRGTGGSQGRYTQDFEVLAGDAAAAMAEARRLLGPRAAKAGFVGHSQGGWVAPLAATKTNADYVVIGYGLAIGPAQEDAEQVQYDLERAGFGPEVRAMAKEVSDATAEVMASDFKRGFDKLAAAKAKYEKAPWYSHIKGDYTVDILKYPPLLLRTFGPARDQGTPWHYDPLPALRRYDKPMLWVLAGADDDAPSLSTQAILADLQRDHPRLDVAVYPGTTHGIIRFEQAKDGSRAKLAVAKSYQPLVLNWIKSGQLAPAPDVELKPGGRER
jgi:uncharacterized protein